MLVAKNLTLLRSDLHQGGEGMLSNRRTRSATGLKGTDATIYCVFRNPGPQANARTCVSTLGTCRLLSVVLVRFITFVGSMSPFSGAGCRGWSLVRVFIYHNKIAQRECAKSELRVVVMIMSLYILSCVGSSWWFTTGDGCAWVEIGIDNGIGIVVWAWT